MGRMAGLTVVINGDATQFNAALRNMRAEAASLKASMAALNKQLKLDPTSYDLIARKQAVMNEYIAQQRTQLKQTQYALKSMREEWNTLSDAQKRNYVSLEGQADKLRASIAELTEEAYLFGAGLDTATVKFSAMANEASAGLSKIASSLAPISIAMGALGAVAAYTAVDFESAFAGVRKTVNATEVEYERLRQAALDFSTTKPVSASDVADIMTLGGQLGVATQNLTEFSDVIADLSVATDLELEDAATYLAQFVNIAGDKMSMEQIDRLGATIADLGNNSATTESQIVLMSHRMVGALTNAGASVPEVLALATALSSTGIRAEMGGNAISTVVNKITRDVAEGTDTLNVWAETAGMSAEEFTEAWTGNGGANMMNTLLKVVDGMSDYKNENQELITLLDDMGITYMRQIDMMQRLSRVSGMTTDYVNMANYAWQSNTALVKEANQRYATTESQLKIMLNELAKLGIAIGTDMLPGINEIAQAIGGAANDLSNMDGSARGMVLTIGAIGLLAAPVTKLSSAFASLGGNVATTIGNIIDMSKYMSVGKVVPQHLSPQEMAKYEQGMTAYNKALSAAKNAAMGLASVAATGLVVALVTVAAKCVDAAKKQQAFEQALKNVGVAARKGVSDANASAKAIDEMRIVADSTAMSVEELTGKLNSISSAYSTNTNKAAVANKSLEDSLRVITEYDPTKDGQLIDKRIELTTALRTLNGELGTNYQLMDDGTIAYENEEKQVRENIDALKDYIREKEYANILEGMRDAQESAAETKVELGSNVVTANNAYREAKAELDAYLAQRSGTSSFDVGEYEALQRAADEAYKALENANASMAAADSAAIVLSDDIKYTASAYEAGSGSLKDFIVTNTNIQAATTATGVSLKAVEAAIIAAGLSVDDLAVLSETDMLKFAGSIKDSSTDAEVALRSTIISALTDAGANAYYFKDASLESLTAVYEAFRDSGGSMSDALAGAIEEATGEAASVAWSGGVDTGANFEAGAVKGIWDNVGDLIGAWRNAVLNAIIAGEQAAEEHSPSRRTARMAKNLILGATNEIDAEGHMMADAWENAVNGALNAADMDAGKVTLSGLSVEDAEAMNGMVEVTNVYIDGARVNDYETVIEATGDYVMGLKRDGVI